MKDQEMMARIKRGLDNGDITIYLQPQVDFDGKLKGAEALMRWIDPEMGIISPNVVIPIAEKSGMIGKLDMHIWELACKQLVSWEKAGRSDLTISVNISPKDFYYMDIPTIFENLTDKYHVNRKN